MATSADQTLMNALGTLSLRRYLESDIRSNEVVCVDVHSGALGCTARRLCITTRLNHRQILSCTLKFDIRLGVWDEDLLPAMFNRASNVHAIAQSSIHRVRKIYELLTHPWGRNC